jgi:hypothetical protein
LPVIPRTKDERRVTASDSSLVSLRLCGTAAAVVTAVFLVAACGGADTSPSVSGEPISLEQLSRSASTSAAATSGRFSFEMAMTLPGANEPFALSGEGAFDAASERASFAVDLSSFAKLLGGLFAGLAGPNAADLPDFDDPSGWQIEVVQDGATGYVRFPALDGQLPEGKTWVRSSKGGKAGGFDFDEVEQFARSDPRELLDSLRAVTGEVETVGVEELRGVDTTHYHAVIDPAELAALAPRDQHSSQSLVDQITARSGLGAIPVDVWIDDDGLVRKLSLELSATQAGASQPSEASLSFELWDYGERVEIPLPPASQVVDEFAVRG